MKISKLVYDTIREVMLQKNNSTNQKVEQSNNNTNNLAGNYNQM